MPYTVEYFNEGVRAAFDEWPSGLRARYLALLIRMAEHGPALGMPHTRAMGEGLFEVRAKAAEGIGRAFYCTQVASEDHRAAWLHQEDRQDAAQGTEGRPRPHERGEPMSTHTTTPTTSGYAPVRIDPAAEAAQLQSQDPAFAAAWAAQADEFAALDALLHARQRAGLTQEQVAQRMGVKQSALARVESSLGSHKHAPSLATLRKYADAVGCRLEIRMVPQ